MKNNEEFVQKSRFQAKHGKHRLNARTMRDVLSHMEHWKQSMLQKKRLYEQLGMTVPEEYRNLGQ